MMRLLGMSLNSTITAKPEIHRAFGPAEPGSNALNGHCTGKSGKTGRPESRLVGLDHGFQVWVWVDGT